MKKKIVIETIIFFTYALFAMSWVAGSTLTLDIMGHFGIDTMADATWLNNAITLSKIVGNLAAAWFLVKLRPKKAFALASVLITCGVIGAFAPSYTVYVASRFVMGFGGALVIVYFAPIVVRYFGPEERPLVNGINAAAFNTGNLLALLFTGALVSWLGTWQNVTLAISAVSGLLLVIWWVLSEDFDLGGQGTDNTAKSAEYTLKEGFREPVNWWLPITYSGLLFCYISIFALFPLMPDFAAKATHLSAIMIAAGMAGTVAGIISANRYPLRIPVIRFSGLCMTACAATMVLTSNPGIAYATAFLAGFFMFLPMPALTTLPQELPGMTPGRITVVFSMFWSISYLIETLLMYLAGAMADATGNISIAAYFAVACSSTFFLASFFLPETGRQEDPSSTLTAEEAS
ncbi:MFS transporter [Desulfoluna spongiiphila]|uniref:MFS transporter n=1 Tax=Desulfoluna spongiiphila TaxID=419481 RepID=UPI001253F977|nr:MFS transporter [Desulfoluna spongiiphila]VVS95118.1 mfs transporter superfamily [Desulfoluna spongiiphila]